MSDVTVSRYSRTLKVTSQGGLDPNPVFPQYNPLGIYPYQYWGNIYREMVERKFRFLCLENKYLKVAFNIDIGGRPWFIYDKLAECHSINFASNIYSYNAGFGRSYTCGGLEVNYPSAHSPTTRLPREHSFKKNPDGSASVIISEYEQRWRTRWSVTYTLYPDKSYLEMTPRLCNRTAFDTRYMYWSNCGIPLNDDTEFIFPEKSGSMHGDEHHVFSWPIWQKANLCFWKNTTEPLGLYMLDATEDYFGYYDHGADVGLAHWGDLADLPGKKYWSWGSNPYSKISMSQTHHPDGKVYGEIQAGRVVIQEHMDKVPPQTQQTWNEYWYPVRSTGRFHGAGKGAVAAINTSADDNGFIGADKLKVSVQGTGTYQNAKVVVTGNNLCEVIRKVSITPEKVADVKVVLDRKIKASDAIDVLVISNDGELLCRAHRQQTNPQDSGLEIPDPRKHQNSTAESLFMEAAAIDRDWFNYDSRRHGNALSHDPDHSPTLLEIGKLDMHSGLYGQAIEKLSKALKRNSDSLEIKYFLALAYELTGDLDNAIHWYQVACRYDFESRSRARLASIYMRTGFAHDALRHLNRLCEMSPLLDKYRVMRSAVLFEMGKKTAAKQELAEASTISETEPLTQFEIYNQTSRKSILNNLFKQTDAAEPALLECAYDYIDFGLYSRAMKVVEAIDNPSPLVLLTKAWIHYKNKNETQADNNIKAACRKDLVNTHAWRLEMLDTLNWAIQRQPKQARLHYHLGNILMARWRTDGALKSWKKAEKLGEQVYLLQMNIGNWHLNVAKDRNAALNAFQKARKLCDNNLYQLLAEIALLSAMEKYDNVLKLLNKNPKALSKSCQLGYHFVKALLKKQQYAKLDKFVASCNYGECWNMDSPLDLLPERYTTEALCLFKKGKYKQAIELFEKTTDVPENLRRYPTVSGEGDVFMAKLYYIGACYEKMGDIETAHNYYEQLVAIETPVAWEPSYWYEAWRGRYFQALALQKLGRNAIANVIFDSLEKIAKNVDAVPPAARQDLLELAATGMFGEGFLKAPGGDSVQVDTIAEL